MKIFSTIAIVALLSTEGVADSREVLAPEQWTPERLSAFAQNGVPLKPQSREMLEHLTKALGNYRKDTNPGYVEAFPNLPTCFGQMGERVRKGVVTKFLQLAVVLCLNQVSDETPEVAKDRCGGRQDYRLGYPYSRPPYTSDPAGGIASIRGADLKDPTLAAEWFFVLYCRQAMTGGAGP